MRYQFEYKLTEEDYLDFNVFRLHKSKNNPTGISWIGLMILLLLSMVMISQGNYRLLWLSLGLLILWVLIKVVTSRRYGRFSIKKQIQSIAEDGKLPFGKDNIVSFHEDFVFEIADGNESKTIYENLEKVAVGENAIYIYMNAIQAFILPFSIFETEVQRNEFLTFIKQKAQTHGG
ncbi:MAG: YcxB family protein [Oscillospiraceae bacterium]|nr:YcxB family protein [Oscillospiraceae bacterium]